MKLYRRAELEDETSGNSLIEALYVDPLPNNHVPQTMLKSHTTFLIGRKGTGKSTVFQRAQDDLRKRPTFASAYIDIKTIFESSQIDPSLIAKVDPTSGALPKESLEKLRLDKAFLRAVIEEINEELRKRAKHTSVWARIKRFFSGSIDELFEGLDSLISDIDNSQFKSITGLKTLTVHDTSQSSEETDIESDAKASLSATPGLSASLTLKAS